jgi:isochorismate synthase
MVDDGMERLAARLGEASARARSGRRTVLLSVVERLASANPVGLIAACDDDDLRAALAPIGADDRMYWARPNEQFAIAGLGAATTLTARGPDRFAEIERAWNALVDTAITEDADDAPAGIGPLLMGGAAFEPEGPHSARWDGFSGADFIVPRFLVTTTADGSWLTTTILVGSDGTPDVAPDTLGTIRDSLVQLLRRSPESASASKRTALRYTDLSAPSEWRELVQSAVDAIGYGFFQKVVLARAVQAVSPVAFDVAAVLRHLRTVHPDSFIFACWRGERVFVGASPERLVRLDEREVLASSLAGSARRGVDAEEDALLASELLGSAKDAYEHSVVVRALRDTLGQLCDDVQAASTPSVLTLPHMHHLHTIVRARLRDGHSLLELVGRVHPTPAVGGTPRDAALAFIRSNERLDRGWYAAPVGWLGRDRGEFAVALRSALIRGDEATLYAGCGVVRDSDPDLEYAESVLKLQPMMKALAAAQGAGELASEATGDGRASARGRSTNDDRA